MAGTIGSVVNRANMPRLLRVHAVGLLLGATTMALALTLLGAVAQSTVRDLARPLAIVACVVLLGWALQALDRPGLPFPQRSWQVPEQWRYTLPPVVTAGAYGYLLGLGWLTYLVLPTFWLLVVGTFAAATLPVSALAWTAFALGRFLTTRRYAHRVASGSSSVKPSNLHLTRISAAVLLTLTAITISAQVA